MSSGGVLTVGVEEEFLLVNRVGRLAPIGPELSVVVDGTVAEGQVEHELRRCQVESATAACATADELLAGLRDLRDRLAAEAAAHGLRLLPSGTAPLLDDRPARLTPDDRYQRMARELGPVTRTALTCGCHVHIAIPDRTTGLRISNHIRPWLPVLLAITANSPFHDGVDTRYASWRHELFQRWPSAGPPPRVDSLDQYESRVAGLLASGAILDRGMIYWDIRLSAHQPTVEIRISDVAATTAEAATLAVLIRGLAGRATEATDNGPEVTQEVLRGRLWRSARDGLAGHCVDPRTDELVPTWQVVAGLVTEIRPWLRSTGDDELVRTTLAHLHESGGGAQRQRAAFAAHERLADVIDHLAWPTGG